MSGLDARDLLSFLPGIAEKLGYYVYALRDPRDGAIFYVGKGKGDRVYQHAKHARVVRADQPKSQLKVERIVAIHRAERDVGVEIVRHGLTEEEAFEVEAGVIDALSLMGINLTNAIAGQHVQRGWRPLEDLVSEYAATPCVISPEHRAILIRVNTQFRTGMTSDELYEATRKWWVVNPVGRRPEWAFSVYNGIVRAVYRIDDWESDERQESAGRQGRRRAFRGARDPAMEDVYVWRDVSGYLSQGAQNPIRYVNC